MNMHTTAPQASPLPLAGEGKTNMRALKLVGLLLDYPKEELWQHRQELTDSAHQLGFAPQRTEQLSGFMHELFALDPMAAQECWLGLFDRGRAMSLLLFEHIHGESRDRGQAMVDLIETYRSHGFELASRELPDYLPLVLEYLSRRPEAEVIDWLSHIAHILELLAARAAERGSGYALLFELLVELGRGQLDLTQLRRRVATEARDDSPAAMDAVWEEEAVRFGPEAPASNCQPPSRLSAAPKPDATVMP